MLPDRLRRLAWRALDWAERDKFTVLTAVMYVLLLSALRVSFEKFFLDFDGLNPLDPTIPLIRRFSDPWAACPADPAMIAFLDLGGDCAPGPPVYIFLDSLYNWAHDVAFFLAAFVGGSAVLHLGTGVASRRVLHAVAAVWPIILIAPPLDRFVYSNFPSMYTCSATLTGALGPTNTIACYEYVSFSEIARNFATFFSQSHTPWGIRTEIVLIFFLVVGYAWAKTHSVIRAMGTWLGIYLWAALIGSVFLAGSAEFFRCGPGFGTAGCNSLQVFYFEVFLLGTLLMTFVLVDRSNKRIVPYLLRTPGLPFAVFPVLGALAGVLLSPRLPLTEGTAVPVIILALLTAAASWGAAALCLDAWGESPVRRPRPNPQNAGASLLLLLAAVLFVAWFFGAVAAAVAGAFGLSLWLLAFARDAWSDRKRRRAAPLALSQRRNVALLALVVAAVFALLLGPFAFFLVSALGAVAWACARGVLPRADFVKNVPWLFTLYFVLVGYFAVNPAASGETTLFFLGNYFVIVPTSVGWSEVLVALGILLAAGPVLHSLARDGLLRRSGAYQP